MQSVTLYQESEKSINMDQFILEHAPLVKKIALHIKKKLPSYIELDDLMQSGLIGLIEAQKNYNAHSGASFETYASIRIRGAIIDLLRNNSWAPRETAKNMKRIAEAISKIEQRTLKQATTEEIALELGISIEDHLQISQDICVANFISLDSIENSYSFFIDDKAENPEEMTQQEITKEKLKKILQMLPEKEQMILSLYYIDEFTFSQIGKILNLTEARICQLHSQAIAKVRTKLL